MGTITLYVLIATLLSNIILFSALEVKKTQGNQIMSKHRCHLHDSLSLSLSLPLLSDEIAERIMRDVPQATLEEVHANDDS